MDFNKYQGSAASTFKPHNTILPEKARLLDWTLGLSGEVGEVSELIKHHVFHGAELNKMEVAKEMGDVLWYLSAMCETLDMSLADVAELNLAKLSHRHKGKYTHASSADRHSAEVKFEDTDVYQALHASLTSGKDKVKPNACMAAVDKINSGIAELRERKIQILEHGEDGELSENYYVCLHRVEYDSEADELYYRVGKVLESDK